MLGQHRRQRAINQGLVGLQRQGLRWRTQRLGREVVAQQQAAGDQQQQRGDDVTEQAQQFAATGAGDFHARILAMFRVSVRVIGQP
ncbi:hypothetical protein D3C81_1756990 [compost metagenome]